MPKKNVSSELTDIVLCARSIADFPVFWPIFIDFSEVGGNGRNTDEYAPHIPGLLDSATQELSMLGLSFEKALLVGEDERFDRSAAERSQLLANQSVERRGLVDQSLIGRSIN